jgi:hypothetical protein
MFTTYPSYAVYRSLRLTNPMMRGEDVFALQTALNALGINAGTEDGILGQTTSAAIKAAQKRFFLSVDGIAGGNTQKALALAISDKLSIEFGVPTSAMWGQLEHESSFRLGNYSPQRPDGSYDAGVAQRNTAHTPPPDGFTVPDSIEALVRNSRKHYDLFAGVVDKHRRWALAQGAWNAPAFACYLAREEGAKQVTSGMTRKPTPIQLKTFETYVSDVSIHLKV